MDETDVQTLKRDMPETQPNKFKPHENHTWRLNGRTPKENQNKLRNERTRQY